MSCSLRPRPAAGMAVALLLWTAGCGDRPRRPEPSARPAAAVAGRAASLELPVPLAEGPDRARYPLPGPGAALYGVEGVPDDLSRAAAVRAGAALGRTIEPDACLERAASLLLEAGEGACRIWPRWLEEPILHHAGCYDSGSFAFLFCRDDADMTGVLDQVQQGLGRLERRDLSHLGAARSQGRDHRWLYAVLLVPRRLDLASFPRRLQGERPVILAGRVPPAVREVTAFHMAPAASRSRSGVQELEVRDEGSGRFAVEVEGLAPPGEHWLEIMVHDERGPHIGALFPVYVDAPVPQQAAAPPPLDAQAATAEEAEILLFELVNLERGMRGLPLLHHDPALASIARTHARAMMQGERFAHIDSQGRGPRERAVQAGHSGLLLGENLARADRAAEAHENLMASPAHRVNLLDPRFTHIGIGVVEGRGPDGERLLWVVQELSLPQPQVDRSSAEATVREVLRQQRRSRGLRPLEHRADLAAVAREVLEEAPDASIEEISRRVQKALAERGVRGVRQLVRRWAAADPSKVPDLSLVSARAFGVGTLVRREGRSGLREYVVLLVAVS